MDRSVERTFEGGSPVAKRDRVRTLCNDIWEELFDAIASSGCLRRHEKSVLAYLWARCTTKSMTSERYPGHEAAAETLGISPLAVHAALVGLERKGLIRAIVPASRRARIGYRLNAFVLECAYDRARVRKTS